MSTSTGSLKSLDIVYTFAQLSVSITFRVTLDIFLSRFLCEVGTQRAIGVGPPDEALLFVICSPVGPYYPQGFKPVALYGTTEYIRAAPGGESSLFFASLDMNS